ncbi:GNAT family N-acetyltransferase [Sphingomonas sp. BK345]|uniref:GNAT family N-acetyltransferase n=1 Tax=Sphingomonas sp. BK345 TaxID=2586980 RepID=UPI0018210B10|nr:GNAT family N-acetyltransferase [Sphingomonas sp. BK345]MBB3474231.1 putative acetyltransferase [Sphingomonas sp. BK345]
MDGPGEARRDYRVRRGDPSEPAIAALLAAHVADQRAGTPAGFSFALDAARLAAPDVALFAAWDGDVLAAVGALKRLDGGAGEVKSMRAAPAYRGSGAGHAILDAIVAAARDDGLTRLCLETGTTPAYDAALALYRRAGFAPCAAFADYRPSPHNQFLALAL